VLPKISLRDVAARLNVSHCTLNRILKNRSNIECATMDNESGNRKRKTAGKEEVIDKALKKQGEADFSAAQLWFKTHWTDLLSQYSPSDIFNAIFETGL